MAKRRDNMLEAFRQSEESEQPTAEMLNPMADPLPGEAFPAAPAPATSDGVLGMTGEPALPPPESDPFAAQEMQEEDGFVAVATRGGALPQPEIVVPEMPDGGVHLPMGKEAFIVLQVLALAIVFLLGRLTGGSVVSAGPGDGDGESTALGSSDPAPPAYSGEQESDGLGPEPEGQTPAQPGETPTPTLDLPEGMTPAELAFQDPENTTTILAITLPSSDLGSHLAWQNYDLLIEEGFPAIQPRRKGSSLVVLVGAAASMKELSDLQAQLIRTRGPDGKLSYADAYRVNIEDYRLRQ